MKIYISYFNNVRNMNKFLIPVSTAKWDPKWFRREDGLSYIDKNSVINGLKCDRLVFPEHLWSDLVSEGEECHKDCQLINLVQEGHECMFMREYHEYLQTIDFNSLIDWFRTLCYHAGELWSKDESKFDIVLLVHEKPETKCAERPVLVKWFKEHGITLEEWRKEE